MYPKRHDIAQIETKNPAETMQTLLAGIGVGPSHFPIL